MYSTLLGNCHTMELNGPSHPGSSFRYFPVLRGFFDGGHRPGLDSDSGSALAPLCMLASMTALGHSEFACLPDGGPRRDVRAPKAGGDDAPAD